MWTDPKKLRRNARRNASNEAPFNPYVREQLAEQRAHAMQELREKPLPWYSAMWAAILAFFVRG